MLYQVSILIAILNIVFADGYVEHHYPQPYEFGYSVKDHHGEQHRHENGDGDHVKGNYGFTDHRGVHREVDYVADHDGFRALVKTNELGTANQHPADVEVESSAHPHIEHHGGHGYDKHEHDIHGYGHDYAAVGHEGHGYGYEGY